MKMEIHPGVAAKAASTNAPPIPPWFTLPRASLHVTQQAARRTGQPIRKRRFDARGKQGQASASPGWITWCVSPITDIGCGPVSFNIPVRFFVSPLDCRVSDLVQQAV